VRTGNPENCLTGFFFILKIEAILRMGIFIFRRIGPVLRTCLKNRNQQFSRKNENWPTLVLTMFESRERKVFSPSSSAPEHSESIGKQASPA
jgi:hypothetical protein